MTCEYRNNGNCTLAESLCDVAVPCTDDACQACERDVSPRSVNQVTVSLAHYALTSSGFKAKAHGLFAEHKHRFVSQVVYLGDGVGTELHTLLKLLGYDIEPNCPCLKRIRELNERGVQWAEQNVDLIVSWLREEHARRKAKVPFIEAAVRRLIRLAIWRAKRKEQASMKTARFERRKQREARRAARKAIEASMPPLVQLAENNDPLVLCDRNKQPIGHLLRNVWAPNPGFLVCGGPSINSLDLSRLTDRGIVSLAINNAAAWAPVRAMVFGDPPEKFHHGVFFDPSVMKFCPRTKLTKRVRAKTQDGEFKYTPYRVMDCPNVWGFERCCEFWPEKFLTSEAATWGNNNRGVDKTGGPKVLFTFFLGLRLIHYLGCRRVYLLGADFNMQPANGRVVGNYAFPQAGSGTNNSHYGVAMQLLAGCLPHFKEQGFEVYNCNPKSALKLFPFVSFEDALTDCRGAVPVGPLDTAGWYEKPNETDEDRE